MGKNNITPAGAYEMLLSARRLLILTHEHPDGDTLGCALALKESLAEEGREVELFCCDQVPENLRFLISGAERLEPPADYTPDLICAVDTASPGMLGSAEETFRGRVALRIDHHGTGEDFAEYNYTEPDAAACGEIVFDMLEKAGRLNARAADALYAAVASDTGCFKFRNTTARTHSIAARLIEAGAGAAEINRRLFETRLPSELRATRLALENLHYYADGKIAVIGFTNDMKEKYSITDDDISPLHSLPREISGVALGITIRQQPNDPGAFKVSMRSVYEVDSSELCAVFGGGGHRCAAGCTVRFGSLAEAEAAVVAAAADRVEAAL